MKIQEKSIKNQLCWVYWHMEVCYKSAQKKFNDLNALKLPHVSTLS